MKYKDFEDAFSAARFNKYKLVLVLGHICYSALT